MYEVCRRIGLSDENIESVRSEIQRWIKTKRFIQYQDNISPKRWMVHSIMKKINNEFDNVKILCYDDISDYNDIEDLIFEISQCYL